jgi:hypothetical protein
MSSLSVSFVPWGERFFAHIEGNKTAANSDLLELVYCLGDDGRQEMALSIFNFLRSELWQEFCRERKQAGRVAAHNLRKAAKDLKVAANVYRSLLLSMPELSYDRVLSEGKSLHLSDILEKEAEFLAGLASVSVAGRKANSRNSGRSRDTQSYNPEVDKKLQLTSRKLICAAASYRRVLSDFPIVNLPTVLEMASEDASRFLPGIPLAFSKKRKGVRYNWGILIRLQEFVEGFGRRWGMWMPASAARRLTAVDLSDLLEAGIDAQRDDGEAGRMDEIFSPEAIRRALLRFRTHKNNVRICLILRDSASKICDQLRMLPG